MTRPMVQNLIASMDQALKNLDLIASHTMGTGRSLTKEDHDDILSELETIIASPKGNKRHKSITHRKASQGNLGHAC
eukprot:gene9128-16251_t